MFRGLLRQLLVILLLSSCPILSAIAITDIENVRMTAPEGETFVGETDFQAAGTSGNSESATLTFKNNAIWLQDASEYMILFKYRYGQSFDVKNANEGFLHFRYSRDIETVANRWENYIQADTNEFRNLTERSLIGSNLSWRIRDQKDSKVNFALGAFAYRERLEVEEPDLQSDEGVRMNAHLVYSIQFLEATALSLGVYYQPKVGEWDDAQTLANIGLDSPIAGNFSSTLDVEYRHDSEPPPEVEPTDLSYTAGLKYTY